MRHASPVCASPHAPSQGTCAHTWYTSDIPWDNEDDSDDEDDEGDDEDEDDEGEEPEWIVGHPVVRP